MKKLISKFLVLAVLISAISSAFVFSANAASASITLNKSSYSVGDTVSATIKIKGSNMTGADLYVSYNSSNLKYSSGATSGGAGSLRIVTELDKVTSKSFTIKFKALKNGSSAISVSGFVSDGAENALPEDVDVSYSRSVIVKDPEKSTNANLKSLSLEHGTLSPSFSASVTSYTAKVPNNVTSCSVFASASDSKASIDIVGNASLKVGQNVRKVVVTAQSGATKTYTITITRLDEDEELENEEVIETENPLETVIAGVKYVISTDISSVKLLNGFSATNIDFKGTEVPVAVDSHKEFVFYYLSTATSDTLKPYTYNSDDDSFTPVSYMKQSKNDYIFTEMPDIYATYFENKSYKKSELKLGDFTIDAYISPLVELSDFYYVYAYFNGEYSMYRYDAEEKVLQRSPDFNLNTSVAAPVKTETKPQNDDNFLTRFNRLGHNAKILVIALAGAALCTVVLIILLVVKLFTRVKYKDDLEEDFVVPYNNTSFNNDFKPDNNTTEENKQE